MKLFLISRWGNDFFPGVFFYCFLVFCVLFLVVMNLKFVFKILGIIWIPWDLFVNMFCHSSVGSTIPIYCANNRAINVVFCPERIQCRWFCIEFSRFAPLISQVLNIAKLKLIYISRVLNFVRREKTTTFKSHKNYYIFSLNASFV